MRIKALTLVELVAVVIMIGILATLGYPVYTNIIEGSKTKICQSNLDALSIALDIYVMENDSTPGDLSQIPTEYFKKAYACVLQRKGAWKVKLAHFILDLSNRGLAYANGGPTNPTASENFLRNNLARGDIKILHCPGDSDTNPSHISYGINKNLEGRTAVQYKTFGDTLIADCNQTSFMNNYQTDTHRHKKIRFPLVTDPRNEFAIGVNGSNLIKIFYDGSTQEIRYRSGHLGG